MPEKLTKPQRLFLQEVRARPGRIRLMDMSPQRWRMAEKLVGRGLLTPSPYSLTEAGRKAAGGEG